MKLGNNIKKHRTALSLTQEQLADRLSVSAQAVSKWERGENMPDAEMLPQIADVLGVSIDTLFDRSEKVTDLRLARTIADYMIDVPNESLHQNPDKIKKIRKAAYMAEYFSTCLNKMSDDELARQEKMWNVSSCHASASNGCAGGFTFDSNHSEAPFFAVFEQPENGFGEIFRPYDKYKEIFALLADENAYSIVGKLYRTNGISFDDEYAKLNFGENSIDILEKMSCLRIISSYQTVINDNEVRLWSFTPKNGLIALLCVLYEYVTYNNYFDLQSNSRKEPYIK